MSASSSTIRMRGAVAEVSMGRTLQRNTRARATDTNLYKTIEPRHTPDTCDSLNGHRASTARHSTNRQEKEHEQDSEDVAGRCRDHCSIYKRLCARRRLRLRRWPDDGPRRREDGEDARAPPCFSARRTEADRAAGGGLEEVLR